MIAPVRGLVFTYGRPMTGNCPTRMTLLLSMALACAPVCAQDPPPTITYTVNTTADLIDDNTGDTLCHTSAGSCSLRAALMQVNHRSASALIFISVPAGQYRLTRLPGAGADETHGDLDLTVPLSAGQAVYLSGAGATRTILDADQIDRVLDIGPERVVDISGLSLRNGHQGSGGGIQLVDAALTIRDCVIEANHADNDGGGVYQLSGSLGMRRCSVRANTSGLDGGGLYLSGDASLRDSTVSANTAQEGGGIMSSQRVVLVNSTISANAARGDGGGIYNRDTRRLYNVSVIGNDADHDRDEEGGIGGGVYGRAGRTLALVNSLIVDNTVLDAPFPDDCAGMAAAAGQTAFTEIGTCEVTGPWFIVAQSDVGPLQDNGGATPTHALQAQSFVIDATSGSLGCVDETGALLQTDQRGFPRVIGARCDIGAFEYGAERVFNSGFE